MSSTWRMSPPIGQPIVAGIAATSILLIAAGAADEAPRLGAAALVGALAGFALSHAAFGFTAGWRRFQRERRGAGLRAQLWLVALTAAGALPLIQWVDGIGGFVFPFGVAVAVGAAMFGFGMQLAGGCGSGTLFSVGGGSTRMLVTLAFFIAGGLLATLHWPFWDELPCLPAVSLGATLGVPAALGVTLVLLAAVGLVVCATERRRHGSLEPRRPRVTGAAFWRGPWPLSAGVVALTAVGLLTLVVLGRPWGITSGLTLWGAKIADAAGVPVETWPYWENAMGAVRGPLLADGTSVMNLGLIAGATLATALAGRYAPTLRLSTRDVLTAVMGGLLMGYGARIAFGCNIGALLGGIASGSLHGWGWFLFAFAGSFAGVRVRAILGMDRAP